MVDNSFKFEISLSVLNHLGRGLYRNFITVLGEAISNAWDAEAEEVRIYIERDAKNFVIKDNGNGMTSKDFQDKFLKVGYSKRKGEHGSYYSSNKKRPYIGNKGIGKLALLSCAEKVSVISKTEQTEYVGGLIDNSSLDLAIKDDVKPDKYPLGKFDMDNFEEFITGHKKGTIIYFEQYKDGIRNTIPYLKKLLALFFRFSLIDSDFKIFVNNELVSFDDLKDLSDNTEFVWIINKLQDPFLSTLENVQSEPIHKDFSVVETEGFIGSVTKPSKLKITGAEEKAGIDLFVNGRLRERDILRHMPDFATRIIASYLYGQIHFNILDKEGEQLDRFTSSRESVISGDAIYEGMLEKFKTEILNKISNEWDCLRLSRGEDGDDENPRKTKQQRKALSLFNLSSGYYKEFGNDKVDGWIKELRPDAEFNIPAYVDCFLSENLIRKYIETNEIPLTSPAATEVTTWRDREQKRKDEAGISFDIREDSSDLSYLGILYLSKVADDNGGINTASLVRDCTEYTPMRNAVGHTVRLSENAKTKLNLCYENIKARLRVLLSQVNNET